MTGSNPPGRSPSRSVRVNDSSSRAGPLGLCPAGHTARRSRRSDTPETATSISRRDASSSPTASSLSTEGPAPLTTAALTAVVEDSSSSGAATPP